MAYANDYSQPVRPRTNTGVPQPQDGQDQAPAPQGGYNYEQLRDTWMSGKYGSTEEGIRQLLQENPQFAQGVNYAGSGDSIQLPHGGYMDLIPNFKSTGGGGGNFWTAVPDANSGGGSAPGPMPPPTGGVPGVPGAGPTGPSPYTPGALPTAGLQAYKPGQVGQFTAPNQSGANSIQQQALLSALQGGGSLNPQAVAQMKGVQQDQAGSMLQQNLQRIQQQAAMQGRGQSGLAQAQEARARDAMQQGLLGGYRDIDVNAAQTNFNDILRASGALDSSLGREAGTASDFYRTGLTGQLAQEDLNQRGVASSNEGIRFELEKALAGEGLKQTAAGMGEGSRQFDVGQALARAQMGQQNQQFYAGLGEQGRQYNLGYGLNAAQLQRQREQDYWNMLMGGR